MNRPLFVLLLSLSIPAQSIGARADEFCDVLKKIVAETPGKYRALAKGEGSEVPATISIPGFDAEIPGTTVPACNVYDTPHYSCISRAPLTFDPANAARQCLAGWKESNPLGSNRLKQTVFSNGTSVVTVTTTSDPISYTLMVQPGK